MSEETTQVGNSDPAEGDSQSSGAGSQQSVDLTAVQSKLAELEKLYKGLQKGTDKVNARVEQRVSEALSGTQIGRIAELAKAGKSSEEIENQLLLEEMLAERKGRASGVADPLDAGQGKQRAGGGNEGQNILGAVVKAFGLDANDADVAEALSQGDISALAGVVKSKITVPEPDASDNPLLLSKEKQGEDANSKALKVAYDKQVEALRARRMLNAGTLADLKRDYRKKGLQIY